jgi:hypothetical protein
MLEVTNQDSSMQQTGLALSLHMALSMHADTPRVSASYKETSSIELGSQSTDFVSS